MSYHLLAAADARIADLEAQLAEVTRERDEVRAQLARQRKRDVDVELLEVTVVTQGAKIAGLEARIADLEARIAEVTREREAACEANAYLRAEIEALRARVAAHEAEPLVGYAAHGTSTEPSWGSPITEVIGGLHSADICLGNLARKAAHLWGAHYRVVALHARELPEVGS